LFVWIGFGSELQLSISKSIYMERLLLRCVD